MKNKTRFLLIVGFIVIVLTLTACGSATPTAVEPKQAIVGSWTSTVMKEDLARVVPSIPQEFLCENAGTFVWKFNADGTLTIDQTALPDCPAPANPHIEDTWSLEGNVITFAEGTPNQEIYEISIDGGQLTFVKAKSSNCPPCMAINTANSWKRVE